MLTTKNRDDLEIKGYTIVENVIPNHAQLKKDFFDWMKENFQDGVAPYSVNSIVRHYGIGYLEPTWTVRLMVKKYFAQLWGTEELLTSVDALAIGQPPEMGNEDFDSETNHWLHVDQCAARIGLHGYQGAVYLETADEDDWTFEVLEGSHQHLEVFYAQNNKAMFRSVNVGLYRMTDKDLDWYNQLGCVRKRVPVQAGSLLLWDSRLVHANARPIRGRENPQRWRLIVLVCMGPSEWSTKEDIEKKKRAYKEMRMTTHWPSDDVGIMGNVSPPSYAPQLKKQTLLPEIAKSHEVKQLMGVVPYKHDPSTKKPAWRPKWNTALRPDMAKRSSRLASQRTSIVGLVLLLLAGFIYFLF